MALQKFRQNSASVLSGIALMLGIVCVLLAVLMVIVMLLPGGEYGPYRRLFNLCFPALYLIGPLFGTAAITLGVIARTFETGKTGNVCSMLGIAFGCLPNAITLTLIVLFLFGCIAVMNGVI